MTCPRCRNEGARRRKNGRHPDGRQKWRVQCDDCRRHQQRAYQGREAYEADPWLTTQVAIDEARGMPW